MRSKILWGLVIVSIAVLVFVVRTFMEQYDVEIWSGASENARRNPYLAAQQFLQQRNVTVLSTGDSLDFGAIDLDDIVFLSRVDSMLVSQSQIDKALDWVARGGYLMVGVSDEIEGQSSILAHFDIEPIEQELDIDNVFVDDDELTASERMREINRKIDRAREKEHECKSGLTDDPIENNEVEDSNAECGTQGEVSDAKKQRKSGFNTRLFDLLNLEYNYEYYKVTLGEPAQELHLAVLDRISLQHVLINGSDVGEEADSDTDDITATFSEDYTLTSWVSDEEGPRLLQFEYGEGTFTALSSAELWKNDYIGLADHAYFLSYLVPNESQLHLFYNVTAPSIWSLIKRYFYEFLWAAFALLILWLWRRSIRVQPLTMVVEGQRRSFAEHLGASAKFLVANKQFENMLEPLKEDIQLQLRTFYPNFSELNEPAQTAILAERTQLPDYTLSKWHRYCRHVADQDELVAALKIGTAIRNKL